MPALVGTNCNPLDILLEGRGDDLLDRAVVAKMDNLGSTALQNSPHDVDGCIVSIKKTGRCDKSNRLAGTSIERGYFLGSRGHEWIFCVIGLDIDIILYYVYVNVKL